MNNQLTTLNGEVDHYFLELKTGLRLHYVDNIKKFSDEKKAALTFVFVHGFPEFWFSWRNQLKYFSSLGYRVVAMDQRGFGETRPADRKVESFTHENFSADLLDLFDKLNLQNVVLVGHDWGGVVVWNFGFMHTSRLLGVASICTPFFPPEVNLPEYMKSEARFDYQIYFKQEGVAEAEFEKDMRRTFVCLMRGADEKDNAKILAKPFVEINNEKVPISFSTVTKRGGVLVGYPDDLEKATFLSEEELQYYVQTFERSGLRGPLNWYRNHEANWEWVKKAFPQTASTPAGTPATTATMTPLAIPALMITAEKDPVLPPSGAAHMKRMPIFPDVSIEMVKDASHWAQQDKPDDVNRVLHDWVVSKFLKK